MTCLLYTSDVYKRQGLKKGIAELKEIRKEFETNLFIPGSKEGMNVELDKAIRLYDFIIAKLKD